MIKMKVIIGAYNAEEGSKIINYLCRKELYAKNI